VELNNSGNSDASEEMEMAKLPALSPRSFTALQEASEFE
jgi:hypothetical protein